MAEKKIATFESIMRDLREGKYVPVYVLMGEESYYIDKISSFIENNTLAPEESSTSRLSSELTFSRIRL